MKKFLLILTAFSFMIIFQFSCKKPESTTPDNSFVNTIWYATCTYPVTLNSIKFEGNNIGTINSNASYITWHQSGNQISMSEWFSSQFTPDTTLFDSTAFSATILGDTMKGTYNDYFQYSPPRNGNPNWILNATGTWMAAKQ